MAASVDLKGVVKHLVDGTLHSNLCRICLLSFGEVSESIFTTICKGDLEYSVADIMDTVCQIKLADTDNFNVCSKCFKMAFNAYKFCMLAKRSDDILNYYVEELDSNVYSIEAMTDHHESLCITFPEYSPIIEHIDFDIDQFLENRTVDNENVVKNDGNKKYDIKSVQIPTHIKSDIKRSSKLDDDNFIIVVMDKKIRKDCHKMGDGKMVLLPKMDSCEVVNTNAPKRRKRREQMLARSCSQCPVKYRFLSKLQMHMKTEHNVNLYICKICKAIFEDEQEYNIHLGTHSDVYQCNYCDVVIKKRQTFINHLLMHANINSNNDPNVCELCGTMLFSDEQLKEHYENKHIKKYTCYYCGKMYKGELSFEAHIKKHEMIMKDKDKKLQLEPTKSPKSKEPRSSKKRLVCATCGKDFGDERALLWHSMLHTDERPYTCDTCGRGFISLNRRNQHELCAHTRPTKRCPLCPALFHLRSMVNTHIKKVHLKSHKRRNRTSKHYNVSWKTEAVPIQELSISIQNEILELKTREEPEDIDNSLTEYRFYDE